MKRLVTGSLILLFLCAAAHAAAFDIYVEETYVEVEKIGYVKHGRPLVRTGAAEAPVKRVLAGAELPEGRRWLLYDPGEGYEIEALGLSIKPSSTAVIQGTPNPNLPPGRGTFGASWLMYLDFQKKLRDFALLFLQLEPGWGQTVQKDLFLISNINHNAHDVGGRVSVRKYWYEHYLFDKQFTLRAGKLRPTDWFDTNLYADDDDQQFLSWMFNSSPSIEWPSGYTFGEHLHFAFNMVDFIELDLGHFEGDAAFEKFFKYGMYIAQVNIKSAQLLRLDPKRWLGNYRFYGWVNNRDHSKYVLSGQTQDLGEFVNYGFGISADQMVTNAIGVFGRVGWQRPDLVPASGGAEVEWSWSAGAQVSGKHWKRKDDHIALAVGQNFTGKPYNDAGNPGAGEGHIETYYSCRLNRCLTVGPDFQIIWNPNGVCDSARGDAEPIFVYGARAHYVF